ncbi:hypothetical protein Mapa_004855 [Marchantia paleacea]|nr:hypothetical protein Mapa_004855 [Marchantia paleacea]
MYEIFIIQIIVAKGTGGTAWTMAAKSSLGYGTVIGRRGFESAGKMTKLMVWRKMYIVWISGMENTWKIIIFY